MFVCICNAVTEDDILGAVNAGARCTRSACEATLAGSNCGSCLDRVENLVEGALSACPRRMLAAPLAATA
ncbi:MAG TPA: (2Fe-2S)-binding protein [Sporichthya sp.]|nr:(2Fe-2S)-binding protein [Sporichthya sp.]